MIKTFISAVLVIAMPLAHATSAQSVIDGVNENQPTVVPNAPNQNTMNNGSQTGQSSQDSGAMLNAMLGAALIAAGMASNPPNGLLIGMGAMALMQALADSKAAGASAQTFGHTTTNPYNNNTDTTTGGPNVPTGPTSPTGTASFAAANLEKANATLAANGYAMTPAGLKNPDGSITPSSAFNSPGAMAAAGIDQATIDASKKIIDQYNKADALKGMSLATDGGGGGGVAAPVDGDTRGHSDVNVKITNPFGLSAADRAKLVAGKTVMLDGEPIGVKGNNIFGMITSCYERKRNANTFIEGSAPQVRAPASVRPASIAIPKRKK